MKKMKKIKTIFKRNWEGNREVINEYIDDSLPEILKDAISTEKLDGINVRVTIRNGEAVRLEKRRNPNQIQKVKDIEEPWYVDANEYAPEDKWLFDALKNTDVSTLPDGEWNGEVVGKNIQGNPLNLENNRIVFFSLGQAPVFENVPVDYEGLREWLPRQKSKYGNNCGIEGIVWHCKNGEMFKIKVKDFKKPRQN